jgi:alpha-ketoglutaric semialdehyde dehydrogenase
MNVQLTGQHLVAGKWLGANSSVFEAVNPANGERLTPKFIEAAATDVNDALAAAHIARAETRRLDPRWPATLLDAIASQIEALGDNLLERGGLETGLPRPRLIGERARTCGQLRMFAKIVREGSWVEAVIDMADASRQPLPKPDLRRMLIPRGPVVVFGASNFPFAFGACGGDTASALAAGNPVVVKGHPSHPGTSELFARAVAAAIEECKLPAGLFALLQGRSHELSAWLVEHPHTQAVGFTGSQRAGRALFDRASKRPSPIPVFAEMGSVNPVVILPGALRERGDTIANDLAASVLLGGGQFCTKPGLVFVVDDREHAFAHALAKHVQNSPPALMLSCALRDNFAGRIASHAKVPGVITLVPGGPSGPASMSPALFETTADVFLGEGELHEEAFGPGGVVVECERLEDAMDCVRSLGGNLTGTLHVGSSDDMEVAADVLRALESTVGRVIVNGYPTGVEVGNAIVHGGPYPATTDAGTTSVGSAAIRRFVRPVAYQNTPQNLLPPALRDENPLGIRRLVNGEWSNSSMVP